MSTVLKYSPKHEQIVLGTCLRHENVLHKLAKRNDVVFSVNDHKIIWAGLQVLVERKLKYTPGTLETILPIEGWQGRSYLEKLTRMAEIENVDYHLDRMRWDQIRLSLYSEDVAELVNLCKDSRAKSTDARRLAKTIHDKLSSVQAEDPLVNNKQLVAKVQATHRARRVAGSTFRPSGFQAIDANLVEGFADHRLSVIAATPSTGKTTFMLNIAKEQALKHGVKVGILAWEGGMQAALDTMVSSGLKIKHERLIKFARVIKDEEQQNIDDFVSNLLQDDKILFLKPPPNNTMKGSPWDVNNRVLDWTEEQFTRWVDRHVIYWDLFLKKLPARSPEHVSVALDRVAGMIDSEEGSVNAHICLLHQINLKILEERSDKRPTRDVLKGSGSWVETPDLVIALYRPALYEPGVADNILDVTCLKQRRGPWPWRVEMDWDGSIVCVSGGRSAPMNPIVHNSKHKDFRGRI